jgi:hypothetical protein
LAAVQASSSARFLAFGIFVQVVVNRSNVAALAHRAWLSPLLSVPKSFCSARPKKNAQARVVVEKQAQSCVHGVCFRRDLGMAAAGIFKS